MVNMAGVYKNFKDYWLVKAKITTMYDGVYNQCRNKIYNNNSTKEERCKWNYAVQRFS